MAKAYWVEAANWVHREPMGGNFFRLNKDWAYSTVRGMSFYWHSFTKPEKKPEHDRYATFERQRWHKAGRTWRPGTGKTRKTCMACKKRIPIPVRVLFELKGK